ncbi:TonB-dependent Receptor Plug Domain [Robiginitalea myxolifaciens]|uniref:TonB-dependent Receptor Plug Domain n=1 Tax=Robiginitalea myxolifaciens TaxID=400055 RepID=A0A1I6HAK4_9FLAO|nr:M56 family metallopeptidase [Robiginitalea myxolifaciens]SFR51400.1 TonB-dependent Receptor Plug Domain [Robiginitalea myxolifaciens]
METLGIYLLKATAIMALFLGTYHLWLKKETLFRLNRGYLLTGLITSLLLPLVSIPREVIIPMQRTEYTLTALPTQIVEMQSPAPMIPEELPLFLYGAIAAFFLLKVARELWKLFRLIQQTPARQSDGFKLIPTHITEGPFSFFRYIFYNPSRHSQEELDMILEHEKAHGAQYHSLDILMGRLTTAILWISPVSWLYQRSIQQNLEYLADAEALRKIPSPKAYQYTLLRVSGNPLTPALATPFYSSLIKNRILMLNTNPSKPYRVFKHLLILPLLALFLMAFSREDIYIPEYLDTDVPEAVILEEPTSSVPLKAATPKTTVVESKAQKDNTAAVAIAQQESEFNKVIEMTIDKGTTDAQLREMKDKFAADDIDFSYTTVRNDAGDITSIEVDIKGPNFSGNYAAEEEDGIDPMVIRVDDEGGLFVGTAKSMSGTEMYRYRNSSDRSHANVWVHRKGDSDENEVIEIREVKGKKAYFINGEEVEESEFTEGSKLKNVIVEVMDVEEDSDAEVIIHEIKIKGEDGEAEEIIKVRPMKSKGSYKIIRDGDVHTEVIAGDGGNSTSTVIITDKDQEGETVKISGMASSGKVKLKTSGKDPLIYIDGKKANKKAMEKLDPDDIEKIEVLKGDKAEEAYGKKARNGVVEITTKKG